MERDDNMSFNREMANMLAGSNVKVIHGEVIGNVDPYIEWIKWLSYIPKFQQLRIQELNSKKVADISIEELNEVKEYRNQSRMLRLFKIYGTSEISNEELRQKSRK